MRLAYFVNQYPAVSHTFIRRELEAARRELRAYELLHDARALPADVAEAVWRRTLGQPYLTQLYGLLIVERLNTASGATWVSLHHGGGVGMGIRESDGELKAKFDAAIQSNYS